METRNHPETQNLAQPHHTNKEDPASTTPQLPSDFYMHDPAYALMCTHIHAQRDYNRVFKGYSNKGGRLIQHNPLQNSNDRTKVNIRTDLSHLIFEEIKKKNPSIKGIWKHNIPKSMGHSGGGLKRKVYGPKCPHSKKKNRECQINTFPKAFWKNKTNPTSLHDRSDGGQGQRRKLASPQ